MKKIIVFVLGSVFLSACAGNPPAWWNPRQAGNAQTQTGKSASAAAAGRTQPAATSIDMEAEELIAVPDEGFEEMALTPLQDEEQENDSGESAAQVMENESAQLVPSILNE